MTGLLVVMLLAERLPVAPVPEELQIPSVRDDMIHHRGFHELSFLPALHAERMALEELLRCFPPLAPVAAAGSRPYFLGVQGFMLITILSPCRH